MSLSLKKYLHFTIKEAYPNMVSLSKIHQIAYEMKKKQATAERELRESESPQVKTEYNSKGHIIGYTWKKQNEQTKLF